MDSSLSARALGFAYFYLKFRPRTEQEIIRYLSKKKFSSSIIERTILSLKEQGLINDSLFIDAYVKDRLQFKPRSVFLLKKELRTLGVADQIIQDYFEIHPEDETTLATTTLQKRYQSLSRIQDTACRFKKAVLFLQRKGFSYQSAKQAYQVIFPSNPFEE